MCPVRAVPVMIKTALFQLDRLSAKTASHGKYVVKSIRGQVKVYNIVYNVQQTEIIDTQTKCTRQTTGSYFRMSHCTGIKPLQLATV